MHGLVRQLLEMQLRGADEVDEGGEGAPIDTSAVKVGELFGLPMAIDPS